MWECTPTGQMTTSELRGSLERTGWLLEHEDLMPPDLCVRLAKWHAALRAENEERNAREAAGRTRRDPC